jgi:hypothetical protein
VLADKKDLCEDEGIDDRESVLLGVQMMLGEDDAFVDGEQSEDNPQIQENYEETPEFIDSSFFELALRRNGKALIHHGRPPGLLRV